MEYQVLIYYIIDSVMMPPAVLPPVLSAESRVATHKPMARLPARSTSKSSTSPLTSQRDPKPAPLERTTCLYGKSCYNTYNSKVK